MHLPHCRAAWEEGRAWHTRLLLACTSCMSVPGCAAATQGQAGKRTLTAAGAWLAQPASGSDKQAGANAREGVGGGDGGLTLVGIYLAGVAAEQLCTVAHHALRLPDPQRPHLHAAGRARNEQRSQRPTGRATNSGRRGGTPGQSHQAWHACGLVYMECQQSSSSLSSSPAAESPAAHKAASRRAGGHRGKRRDSGEPSRPFSIGLPVADSLSRPQSPGGRCLPAPAAAALVLSCHLPPWRDAAANAAGCASTAEAGEPRSPGDRGREVTKPRAARRNLPLIAAVTMQACSGAMSPGETFAPRRKWNGSQLAGAPVGWTFAIDPCQSASTGDCLRSEKALFGFWSASHRSHHRPGCPQNARGRLPMALRRR